MSSKYREYQPQRPTMRELRRIHPVWRGVGFVMMVLIPIISWAGADVLIKANQREKWFPMPYDLLARPGDFLYSLIPDSLIYIRLMFFVAFLFVLFGVFTLVVFIANSMFGITPRNDPFYVPPIKRKVRKAR